MKEDTGSSSDTTSIGQAVPCGACPCCRQQATTNRLSLAELATNVVCAGLLLAILIPAVYLSEQWLDHQCSRVFGNLIWHEHVEEW